MTCQCSDVGLDELFDAAFAEKDARRYLKRGLPPRARRLFALIKSQIAINGASTLEGGSGAGAVTVELARQGARAALGVDAMQVAVERARRLARELDAPAAQFQLGDFADPSLELPKVDLVVLDRVVCCYPDWQALLARATASAPRVIALSYPPANVFSRVEAFGLNSYQKLRGRKFRLHLHSPETMRVYLGQRGFALRRRKLFWIWELAVYTRS